MQLAISGQLLSHTHDLASIIEIVRSLGVNALELWPENIAGGETKEERARYEGKDLGGVRDLLQASHTSIACVTLSGVLRRALVEGPDYGTQALLGAIDAATILGSNLVNCYLEGLTADLFLEIVRPAVEYAASKQVTLVLENEAHDDSGSAEGVKTIVEKVNSPYFGTVYDPCNYYQAHEEPYPGAYETLKEHIHYVHLKGGCRYHPQMRPQDHRGGMLRGSEDAYIGYTSIQEGVANVDGILHRLARDGYTGFITLEPHVSVEDALTYYQADVAYMRARLKELHACI
jgi:sugar phosphate isomerase/epimerase